MGGEKRGDGKCKFLGPPLLTSAFEHTLKLRLVSYRIISYRRMPDSCIDPAPHNMHSLTYGMYLDNLVDGVLARGSDALFNTPVLVAVDVQLDSRESLA